LTKRKGGRERGKREIAKGKEKVKREGKRV
jgi:hypothetical protein